MTGPDTSDPVVVVPADLDVEDRIVGPVTFRLAGWLAASAAGAALAALSWPAIAPTVLGGLVAVAGLAGGFVRLGVRPIGWWARPVATYLRRAHRARRTSGAEPGSRPAAGCQRPPLGHLAWLAGRWLRVRSAAIRGRLRSLGRPRARLRPRPRAARLSAPVGPPPADSHAAPSMAAASAIPPASPRHPPMPSVSPPTAGGSDRRGLRPRVRTAAGAVAVATAGIGLGLLLAASPLHQHSSGRRPTPAPPSQPLAPASPSTSPRGSEPTAPIPAVPDGPYGLWWPGDPLWPWGGWNSDPVSPDVAGPWGVVSPPTDVPWWAGGDGLCGC